MPRYPLPFPSAGQVDSVLMFDHDHPSVYVKYSLPLNLHRISASNGTSHEPSELLKSNLPKNLVIYNWKNLPTTQNRMSVCFQASLLPCFSIFTRKGLKRHDPHLNTTTFSCFHCSDFLCSPSFSGSFCLKKKGLKETL